MVGKAWESMKSAGVKNLRNAKQQGKIAALKIAKVLNTHR